MRKNGLPIALLVLLVLVALLYFGVIDRVSVFTVIEPGGRDVIVRVDGSRLRPAAVTRGSNLYSFSLRHGKHLITVEKPGYRKQRQILDVKWGDGDEYPIFPPLRRVHGSSGALATSDH